MSRNYGEVRGAKGGDFFDRPGTVAFCQPAQQREARGIAKGLEKPRFQQVAQAWATCGGGRVLVKFQSNNPINSSSVQTWSARPEATAGLVFKVL